MREVIEKVSRWLALICRLVAGVALLAMLLVTIGDVATRYLHRLTDGVVSIRVVGSVELVSYLMLFALLSAMAANVEKSQVVVEAFTHSLPESLTARLHGFYLLGFALLGAVLCVGLSGAASSAAGHGEVTQDLRLPLSPIYISAALLSALLGLRSLLHALLGMIWAQPTSQDQTQEAADGN
ncbi:TRAP transporter small permease [Halomonas huangheensis]|uniref:TRAP transporter small permease protein n=1 Tax=Halomonas huangheensis TaxID=1178482 RepID=W1NBB1_9GAMM|nr:TRAP transporter small permease subunit [Halomonas huangheensis]ALM53836.1 C4-dicarboxylate ABC transporter permease [Halomonas huangheensis]ERL52225.1 hypothetical protein BJB45_09675 [Halomonas huangheensis]